jgi:predicted GNAT family N-acyltransferase
MTYEVDTQPGPDRMTAGAALRTRVFVHEQGVDPAIERDGHDGETLHVTVSDDDGAVIGTGRLMLGDGYAKVQRVAVDADRRGEGIGRKVMEGLDLLAAREGISEMRLSSQAEAVPFYERLGYVPQGDPYLEAGIVHLAMSRQL